MNRVAQNIRKRRMALRLTQDALAEKLHVVRQTVSLWETGKREPDIDTLLSIAAALDCEVTELIYGPRPTDRFLEEKPRRARLAVTVSALFLLLLLAETLIKPPVVAILNSTYTLFLLRLFLVLVLPMLLYTCGGMAAVFALAVFQDLRIRRLWIRLVLLLVSLLVTVPYLIGSILWMPPGYFRIFDFLVYRPMLFLLPGMALGFALNR